MDSYCTSYVFSIYFLLLLATLRARRHISEIRKDLTASDPPIQSQSCGRWKQLSFALWGSSDIFWAWDMCADQVHHFGADHLHHTLSEGKSTAESWWRSLVHPDDLPLVRQQMRTHLEGGSDIFEIDHRIRNAHGAWTWVRMRARVVERDHKARPLRVAGTVRDITTIRHIEHGYRIASEVLNILNEAVAVIDHDFRFVSANPAFLRMTGYRAADIPGLDSRLLNSKSHALKACQQISRTLRKQGRFTGELRLQRADGNSFLVNLELIEIHDPTSKHSHYVAVLEDITEKKQAEQKLHHLNGHDALTGLCNRNLLTERLDRILLRAKLCRSQVALLLLNMDRFKLINDSFGHVLGDEVLKRVAERLQDVVGASKLVARLNGDEFILVLEDVESPAQAAAMAETVIAAFNLPIPIEGQTDVVVSLSIGIALYPNQAQAPEDLLKLADIAMCRAKERGRNSFLFYDPSLDSELRLRADMSRALQRALERRELRLEYQPRQTLANGRVAGVEALLRWNSPVFGEVPPVVFIPLAEEVGLIHVIGRWVLREACQCLCRWREQGIDQDIRVAVNVSALQLLRGDMAENVARVLEDCGLPGACLELELTESVVMANAERAAVLLEALKQLDVKIALDDFGTGYSSLAYLKRLPLDVLKIDQIFVAGINLDPDDTAITEGVLALARKLGLSVIAEGVETEEQRNCLRAQGCEQIQGFLFARPMSADACLNFLLRQPGYQSQGCSAGPG